MELLQRDAHKNISIHALLAESDPQTFFCASSYEEFLSTLSLRRATRQVTSSACRSVFLSTLSLRRATNGPGPVGPARIISIHALLAESDLPSGPGIGTPGLFLSTLSLRRATLPPPARCTAQTHFYPRSPCGERQQKCTKQWGAFCAYETNFIGIASSC